MKKVTKRLMSMVLALILCVQVLPLTAMAALLDNDPAYNREILSALNEIVGSEDEAAQYYALLDHYGLLDEDGNLSQSWEIWMDGEQVTLEDITALLEDPSCDPEKYVLVDGQPITLGDIKTILEIEEYLAYLQKTYFDGHQWTAEQQASLQSLMEQIETEGITLTTAAPDGSAVGGSGISHEARVNIGLYPAVSAHNDLSTNPEQTVDKIFDGDITTKWYSTAGRSNSTQQTYPLQAQVEFAEAITIGGYGIVTGNDCYERDPENWKLCGSNDGMTWTEIDAKTGHSLPAERIKEEKFTLSSSHTYRFFRFDVTKRRTLQEPLQTSGYGVQLQELFFYDPAGNAIDLSQNTFKASLTGAVEGQEVSFDWDALSGSQPVSGSGRVEMTADAAGTASAAFAVELEDVTTDTVQSTAALAFYIKADNIENALFGDGTSAVTLLCRAAKTVGNLPEGRLEISGTGRLNWGGYVPYTHTLTEQEKNLFKWGIVDTMETTQTRYANLDKTSQNVGAVFYPNGGYQGGWSEASLAGLTTFGQAAALSGVGAGVGFELYTVTYGATCGNVTSQTQVGYSCSDVLVNAEDDLVIQANTPISQYFIYTPVSSNKTALDVPVDVDSIQIIGHHYENSSPMLGQDGSKYTLSYFGPAGGHPDPFEATVTFTNESAPRILSVSAPAGTYYPGQMVPVSVTFSEPVNAASAKVKFNGDPTEYAPVEGSGYSNVLTFPYTVQAVDNQTLSVSSISATDTGNNTITGHNPGGNAGAGLELEGVALSTPVKADAITGAAASVGGTITANVLEVTVGISGDKDMTAWMRSAQDTDGNLYAEGLAVSLDGGETMHNLYFAGDDFSDGLIASIPLELNTGEEAKHYVAELYLDGALLIGTYATAAQQPVAFIEAEDLSVSIHADGYTFESAADPVIYVQSDMPVLSASFSLTGSGFAFGDTASTAVAGTDAAETADFVWKSSDPTVAAIDADGRIVPTGKAGTTQIALTARNGGVENKAVTVTATYTAGEQLHDSLNFAAGLTPFLLIPNDSISATDGADVTVYWTSNLCDKNGETPTTFTVTVNQGLTEVYSATVSGTAGAPAASLDIPGRYLPYDYSTVGFNTYEVTVSADFESKLYSDHATITLEAQPAQVALGKPDSYYILDTAGSVSIPWSVEHLDHAGGVGQDDVFRFEVTRNDTPLPTDITLDFSEAGSDSGIFELDIAAFSANKNDPASYREVYTVTLQGKNGTHSTWSYDSFLLYVYDEDALEIMVDGAKATGTTMSNLNTISKMDQAQILALKRDIYLKNIISANYGTYAWTEVADQIAWKSSDNSVATINYQQGTLYENIENFSYVSYRPTTQFGLSGLNDGTVTVTAQHKLTGMTEKLTVNVETLQDKLYLFQCYPQAATTLRYQDSTGEWKTVTSDASGAAAIYEEKGIHSDVYCSASVAGITYLGTFYLSDLETGEGDWTRLERYPCNNLTMRRAAYAFLYLKNPDGTPYTGEATVRGGIYVNGEYVKDALFGLNGHAVTQKGYEDIAVTDLDVTGGKLTITMDQTQWPSGMVSAQDDVKYVFEIAAEGTNYYPLLQTVNAAVNIDAYVGNGEAVVTFRSNPEEGKHSFVAAQTTAYKDYGRPTNVLDTTGNIGPNSNFTETVLTTSVMWWGEEMTEHTPKLQLVTDSGLPLAAESGQHALDPSRYPFTASVVTEYKVNLNQAAMDAISLDRGQSTGLALEYYRDGTLMSRREAMPFRLFNLIGVEKVEKASSITDLLTTMGQYTGTDNRPGPDNGQIQGDIFVSAALELVAGDSYSTSEDKLFRIQIAPTSDPTKFLGFIEANVGNIRDKDQVTGIYAPGSSPGDEDIDYVPGLSEIMTIAGKRSIYSYLMDDYNHVLKREKVRNLKMQIGGYAESLIYYNEKTYAWEIQVLNGGFNLGGGVTYSWNWNTMAGPVPLTATLTIGGTVEVSMDALSVAYYNETKNETGLGNDFLTQLRIYLYLHFFAGVGIDYAVLAFKLGIFGQISVDMQFAWLNRPYMLNGGDRIYNMADGSSNASEVNLDGQSFRIDGQIGLEFVVRILFFAYEKILYSYSFNLLNETTRDWEKIQSNWQLNKEAQMSAISSLLGKRALTVSNVGGQQMLTLNLAPMLESRSYLDEGSFWNDGSVGLFALDAVSALQNLQYNSYPYANPVITGDGAIVAYLSDQGSEDVEDTRASFAVRNEYGMYNEGDPIDSGEGFGDSQIAVSGSEEFAAAAWTRQMSGINKDAGAVLTQEDQMIMMNSSEIYAAVYNGSTWDTARLTDNGLTDLAPVVAAKNDRAIVAWRAVIPSDEKTADGFANVTNFEEKDTILYRIYEDGQWSGTRTLYNGTSGAVKGISAAMLSDGTSAAAYTLDTDGDDSTITDREVCYAVVDKASGDVVRNVRATSDAYLDENPQLTTAAFPGSGNRERFVLGWYTEQAVANDAAITLDGGDRESTGETTADIRLLDFNENGIYTQHLPDSISQAASAYNVSITPNFRFTKNADNITDLSILWVERAEGGTAVAPDTQRENTASSEIVQNMTAEKDVLKGIKFYTYGQNSELISFTGAVDVAEMGDGTLIDHFDAYVSDPSNNEIKAVILGSTYGENGTVTKVGTTVGGDTVQYTVPSRTTSMYTATETYADKIEVPAVLADYETIRKGARTGILFTVDNNGIHAVNELEITLSESGGESYATTYGDLNLLPGSSIQLYADYVVPTDRVVDLDYTVQAAFDKGAGASGGAETVKIVMEGRRAVTQDLTRATGKVYLDLPDVEITDASVVSEENGRRTILVKLNNDSDADLLNSGRSVKIGFYSDATCETPIAGLSTVSVAESADLAMIDEGGYSVSAVFDVREHLEDEEITEIPDNGIRLFIKAEVLEEDEVLPEVVLSNNIGSVVCENLKTRTGGDAIITGTLTNNGFGSTATVSIQNTRLSETSTGNVIVTLLDQYGNALAQKQSYNLSVANYGLLSLGGEEKAIVTFDFAGEEAKKAASVKVIYSDKVPEPVTPEVVGAADSYVYTGKPIRPAVTVKVNGETLPENAYDILYGANTNAGQDAGSVTAILKGDYSGEKTVTFTIEKAPLTVTADNKVTYTGRDMPELTYVVDGLLVSDTVNVELRCDANTRRAGRTPIIVSVSDPSGNYEITTVNGTLTVRNTGVDPDTMYQPVIMDTANGTVTISPACPAADDTVTILPSPDKGYKTDTVRISNQSGEPLEFIDNGDGTYSYKQPFGKVEIVVTFAKAGEPAQIGGFADVPADAYYFEAVSWAVERGVTSGTSAATFSPNTVCTRAQAVTFLWRAAGSPEPTHSAMPFADVPADAYYRKAILWALEKGITSGTSETTFSPNAECTRAQIVAFLWRTRNSPAVSASNPFADVASDAYYYDAVLWAAKNSITAGTSATTFGPNDDCTRAQIVTFLYRCLGDDE